jgi:hypothetical protein
MTMNVLGRLYGVADLIPKLPTGTQKRTYLLFKDALTGMGPHTLDLFVAAPDDAEMMRFPAIGAGATLHDGTGAAWGVDEVVVQASSDAGATWQVATAVGPRGHYVVAGLDGLASGGTVRVKVSVNGEAKTDQVGALDYAPFTVAAPGGL